MVNTTFLQSHFSNFFNLQKNYTVKKITMLRFSILLLVTVACCVSCKKNKVANTASNIETPLKTSVESKLPADTIYSQNAGSAEFGIKFYASVPGAITKLGCRMPSTGTYTVSLWDFTSGTLIHQTTVTVSDISQFTYTGITPQTITPDKRYAVSVNTTSSGTAKPYFQLYKKPTTGINIYPFISGTLTIEAPLYKSGTVIAFPNYNNASDFPFLRGVADIQFEYNK
jgi:Domain of unknown function (DUF4082)